MEEWNINNSNRKALAKQKRQEDEEAANEARHLLVHGSKKSKFDWTIVFWIIAFIIGAGAVLLLKNFYYPGPILPAMPSFGILSATDQAQTPPLTPLVLVTATPIVGVQTLDVIPVVVSGVLQAPVWLNPVTSGMPYYDQFATPTKVVCVDVNGFSLPFSSEAKDVYLVKIVTSSATMITIVPGEVQVTSCTLQDQFFLYAR